VILCLCVEHLTLLNLCDKIQNMKTFDYSKVLEEMLNLFRGRTVNPKSVDDIEPSYRVSWSEIFDCMKRHGYNGSCLDGRLEWDEKCGKFWIRRTKEINKRKRYEGG
jgi:hypothetical protein